jgi:hypothetical protein
LCLYLSIKFEIIILYIHTLIILSYYHSVNMSSDYEAFSSMSMSMSMSPTLHHFTSNVDVLSTMDVLSAIGLKSCTHQLIQLELSSEEIREHDFKLINEGSVGQCQHHKTVKNIVNRVKLYLDNMYYQHNVVTSSVQFLNGYHLFDSTANIMSMEDFRHLWELFVKNKQVPFRKFEDTFGQIACSNWSYINELGEKDKSNWDAPEDSFENENAWFICRTNNCNKLFALPYPKEVIIESIIFGCRNGKDSVRYSNFICEWVRRKAIQLNLFNNLYIQD